MDTHPEPTRIEFIRYNHWANQQVVAALKNLSEGQLAATMPGAFGSIRDTLQHILSARVNSLPISMKSMSPTCAPGCREQSNHRCIPTTPAPD